MPKSTARCLISNPVTFTIAETGFVTFKKETMGICWNQICFRMPYFVFSLPSRTSCSCSEWSVELICVFSLFITRQWYIWLFLSFSRRHCAVRQLSLCFGVILSVNKFASLKFYFDLVSMLLCHACIRHQTLNINFNIFSDFFLSAVTKRNVSYAFAVCYDF